MKARKIIAVFVVLGGSLAMLVYTQQRIDAKAKFSDEELLYLPNEKLLTSFTAGMSSVVADVLWLRCIQYTAKEFRGDFKFTWLEHMAKTVTRLDPYFTDVYQWGGVFLAMLKHDNDASINLLKSGIPANPTRWELPFEIARTYVLNRHDPVNGAVWLGVAASTGNPPPFVVDWAKNLQQSQNLSAIERAMWMDILETSSDENMRKVAERKLQTLTLRETAAALNQVVDAYVQQIGRAPSRLDDLVGSGLINALPVDPLGGTYFLDPAGKVQNTSVLEEVREERQMVLKGWLQQYREAEGHFPKRLDELIERGYAPGLPSYPYAERAWQYDPATGEVR